MELTATPEELTELEVMMSILLVGVPVVRVSPTELVVGRLRLTLTLMSKRPERKSTSGSLTKP